MDPEQAKLILSAYHPDTSDANDPRFREALAEVDRSPELARWFHAECALDRRISGHLRSGIVPPPSLRSRLLCPTNPIQRMKRPGPLFWTAAAAAAVLMGTLFFLRLGEPDSTPGFAEYRASMADLLEHRLDGLDRMSHDLNELRQFLSVRVNQGEWAVPNGLANRSAIGCRVLVWNGCEVTLLCFRLDQSRVAHLLIIPQSAFPDAPGETPECSGCGKFSTIAWSRDKRTYLIAGQGVTQQELLKLL